MKISTPIIFFILFIVSFVISIFTQLFYDVPAYDVPCYDREGNEIRGLTCIEDNPVNPITMYFLSFSLIFFIIAIIAELIK